jgi:hypothetical protein
MESVVSTLDFYARLLKKKLEGAFVSNKVQDHNSAKSKSNAFVKEILFSLSSTKRAIFEKHQPCFGSGNFAEPDPPV